MSKEYKYFTKAIPTPNGKRKYIRAKTKRELDKKVLNFQIAQAQGKVVVSNNMTVSQLAHLWLDVVKKPVVKERTYEGYRVIVERHIVPAIGSMAAYEVKPVHIFNVFNVNGYDAKGSNKKLITILRAIFRFAVENDIISKTPVPERFVIPGASQTKERPLTPNQTKALLDYCRSHESPNLYLFTLLALVTGMRRGEIAALRWDCVDFVNNEIQVRRQLIGGTDVITDSLKTEASKREIPIPADVVALLRRLRASSTSTYVIGGSTDGHISTVDIASFARAWNRSGVSPYNIHAHLFRKTYATRLIETGADPKRVQYLLGHTTLDMTLQVYAMYDQESQRKATQDLITNTFSGCVATV